MIHRHDDRDTTDAAWGHTLSVLSGKAARMLLSVGGEHVGIALEELGDFGNERIVRIRFGQQKPHCRQESADGKGRIPLAVRRTLERAKTDAPFRVDVGMIDGREEEDARRLERIARREGRFEFEEAVSVGAVVGSDHSDADAMLLLVVIDWPCADAGRRRGLQLVELDGETSVAHSRHFVFLAIAVWRW